MRTLLRTVARISCILLFAGALVGHSGDGFGEPKLPDGVGPLPDISRAGEPGKGNGAGVAVSSPYTDKYAPVLPPEVAALLRNGELAFEAASKGKVSPALPQGLLPEVDAVELTSNKSLPETYQPAATLPFRRPTEGDALKDAPAVAAKLLWNGVVANWRAGFMDVALRARIFTAPKAAPREVSFSVTRVYPRTFGPVPGKLTSLFREKISLLSPPIVSSLKWLTLRYLGVDEDYLWASSPTTKSVRQLTGSNRADLVFARAFAPDDLFVWGGKVETVGVVSVREVQVLVPVVAAPLVSVESTRDGCRSYGIDRSGAFDLSLEGRRVPQAPPWIPSNAIWMLRTAWRIELVNKDPFSVDVRQVVYVDSATLQPVYRVTLEQNGKVRKVVIGVIGSGSDGGEPVFFWRGEIIVAPPEPGATVLELQTIRTCKTVVPGEDLRAFDPKQLLPLAAPKAKVEHTPIPANSEPEAADMGQD